MVIAHVAAQDFGMSISDFNRKLKIYMFKDFSRAQGIFLNERSTIYNFVNDYVYYYLAN